MATHTASSEAIADEANESAEDRITRLLALFVSSGYLFYFILLYPRFGPQSICNSPTWTALFVVLTFGPPLILATASIRRRTMWIHRAAAACAIGFTIAATLWLIVWNGETVSIDIWISVFPGLAGLAAALTWHARGAMLALLAAMIPAQLINHYCRTSDYNSLLIPDFVFGLTFCLLFVAAALMAVRTGRLLDDTRATAFSTAAAAAAAEARAVQRGRYNALLHDWVMSTLLAAARQHDSEDIRKQSQTTLAKLDNLHDGDSESYDTAGLLAYLRTAISAVDDTLSVESAVSRESGETRFPGHAVHILGEAVAEAVRNSVRHAGPNAGRRATVRVDPAGFEIRISDLGRGFDLDAVPANRLGVAVSIIGRVRSLPGGSVRVTSQPGKGATVVAGWWSTE